MKIFNTEFVSINNYIFLESLHDVLTNIENNINGVPFKKYVCFITKKREKSDYVTEFNRNNYKRKLFK